MFEIPVGPASLAAICLCHSLQVRLAPILAPVVPLAHPTIPTEILGPPHLASTSLRCGTQETTRVQDLRSMLSVVAEKASAQPDIYEGAGATNDS